MAKSLEKPRLLHWALTNCRSLGSFERYLAAMAHFATKNGQEFCIALGDKTPPETVKFIEAAGGIVKLFPVDEMEGAGHLSGLIQDFSPNIVHLHFVSFGGPLISGIRQSGLKIVLTDHASTEISEHRLRHYYRRSSGLRKSHLKDIAHVVAVSNYVRKRVVKWQGADPSMVTTIYNGVDCELYKPLRNVAKRRAKQNLLPDQEKKIWIGFVGQLTHEKGVGVILNVAKRLSGDTRLTFVLIGDGPLAAEVQKNVDALPNLIWLGARDDVAEIMPLFDVLLAPSHFQEAFGLTVAEGMACGLPVIGGDVGAIPEVLSGTGVLTNQTSSRALGNDIYKVLRTRHLRKRGRMARERAVENLSLGVQINRTFELYEKLL